MCINEANLFTGYLFTVESPDFPHYYTNYKVIKLALVWLGLGIILTLSNIPKLDNGISGDTKTMNQLNPESPYKILVMHCLFFFSEFHLQYKLNGYTSLD